MELSRPRGVTNQPFSPLFRILFHYYSRSKVGVSNPGSTDGTVPVLNPIDATLVSKDPKVFAYNLDLFIQHGSTPGGDKPTLKMTAWGDTGALTQPQIADVIAYVMSLNPAK